VHFNNSLANHSGTKKGPKWNKKVSTSDSCQIKEWIWYLQFKKIKTHNQTSHPILYKSTARSMYLVFVTKLQWLLYDISVMMSCPRQIMVILDYQLWLVASSLSYLIWAQITERNTFNCNPCGLLHWTQQSLGINKIHALPSIKSKFTLASI